MKKLFLFALPLLLISCKGVEQYRAGIEELSGNWDNTTKAVTDALGAYAPLQQSINDFATTWTEKSAAVTALKDGLAAGKIEGDVTAQLAELGGLVTTANDNLKAWQGTYGTVKGGVDTAMSALTQLMGTLAPAAPVK